MPRSAASFSATLWLWSIAPLVIGFLLVRLQLAPARLGLALFGLGLLGWLIAALVASAVITLKLLAGSGVPGLLYLPVGSVIALLLVFGLTLGVAAVRAPLIHDISTDTDHPPGFVAAARLRSETDNSTEWAGAPLAAVQRAAYPELSPQFIDLPPAEVYAMVRQTVKSRGWTLILDDPEQTVLEAVARSSLWGFEDDVVIRVTATTSGSRVDMRSASRVGQGDLGANARRIREFLAALEEEAGKRD